MSGASSQVRIGPLLAGLATVVVASTLVASFLVMRSPGEQRKVNIDTHRVQDLILIADALDAHWTVHGALPVDLVVLAAQPGSLLPTGDPVSGRPYSYATQGGDRYRLCAVFDTDSARTGEQALGPGHWNHGAGRHCFDRVAISRSATTAR